MERNIRGTCIVLKCSMDASGDGYKIIFALCEFVMIWACLSVMQYFSSVQSLSSIQLFGAPWTAVHQASMSITNSWCVPNSCPLSRGCHPTISPSVVPFSHFQSFPESGSFQMSQLFTSCGQSIGVSASTWVLPLNIQDSFPLGLTGLISLQSKGLSRVFSMANSWGNDGNSVRLYFGGAQKSLQMVIAAMKLKDPYSLEGKLWPT